jgi:hypothetical protein
MQAHQQPRSTEDLIRELETEATTCMTAALAVGFENTTLFLFSGGGDDNLTKLNDMILAGGEPVGLLKYSQEPTSRITVACRTLAEYADELWAHDYLESLTRAFVDLLKRRHNARPES